jgi:LytR cell envelope-related transcriptional attenuator
VEHSIQQPLDLVHPWRTRAIVAAAIAAVELVVLLVAGAVLVAKPLARHLQDEATAKVLGPAPAKHRDKPAPDRPSLTRGETSVLVLNGNGEAGAAAAEGARIRGLGYAVSGVGNAPGTGYGRSVVMYRRGFRPEAMRLARDAKIAIVTPLDGMRASQLMGAHLALVLGTR